MGSFQFGKTEMRKQREEGGIEEEKCREEDNTWEFGRVGVYYFYFYFDLWVILFFNFCGYFLLFIYFLGTGKFLSLYLLDFLGFLLVFPLWTLEP